MQFIFVKYVQVEITQADLACMAKIAFVFHLWVGGNHLTLLVEASHHSLIHLANLSEVEGGGSGSIRPFPAYYVW